MSMGGGSAPQPDPMMGQAAKMSAETGKEMMNWMKGQAEITNGWAAEDRLRSKDTFQPAEDDYIAAARRANDPRTIGTNADARSSEAVGDVRQQFAMQRQADGRRLASMGVNPNSGRAMAAASSAGSAEALAAAGAANMGRRGSIAQDTARGDGMTANVINLGKGMAVNPGTSMGLSNGAGQAGFNGAMSGYGQQAGILNDQWKAQTSAWNSDNEQMNSLMSGAGQLAGAFMFGSSKKIKHNKKPVDSLGAVRKMPVKKWTYNEGEGDGKEHVGPYAEDFAKATGVGDGSSIDAISMMGVTLGAVQQLDRKLDKMAKGKSA